MYRLIAQIIRNMENGLNHLDIMINKKRTKLRFPTLVHSLPERLCLRSGSYLYGALILNTLQRYEKYPKKVSRNEKYMHFYVVEHIFGWYHRQ